MQLCRILKKIVYFYVWLNVWHVFFKSLAVCEASFGWVINRHWQGSLPEDHNLITHTHTTSSETESWQIGRGCHPTVLSECFYVCIHQRPDKIKLLCFSLSEAAVVWTTLWMDLGSAQIQCGYLKTWFRWSFCWLCGWQNISRLYICVCV